MVTLWEKPPTAYSEGEARRKRNRRSCRIRRR